jgi:hypothetical protein
MKKYLMMFAIWELMFEELYPNTFNLFPNINPYYYKIKNENI